MDVFEPLFNKELVLPEKPYFIADILNANGADNDFVNALFEQENLKEFYGYAAWNTTGNTLGSALSVALTYYSAKIPNSKAFQTLMITRFLDDWAYQANIRAKIDYPQDIIDKINKINNLEVFDNYVVLYYYIRNDALKISQTFAKILVNV